MMSNSTAKVIRCDETVTDDPFHFQIGHCGAPSQPNQALSAVTPQVRVAENVGEYVVLEIVCSCGMKSYVKCEYANP